MEELLSLPYLIESIPSNTQKYNDTPNVCAVATAIPSALYEPQSFKTKSEIAFSDGWQRYVNPAEGRPYFWNPGLRIFTESNITEEHVLNRLIDWSRAMEPLPNQPNRSDCDIVLKVPGNVEQDVGACHDHSHSNFVKSRNTSSSDGNGKKTDEKAVVNGYEIPPKTVAHDPLYQHPKIVFCSLGSYMGR